jgi:peptidyl-prolyl cis-trans isomerase SurA
MPGIFIYDEHLKLWKGRNSMLKRLALILPGLFIFLFSLQAGSIFEEIVARVNSDVITKSEYDKNQEMVKQQLRKNLKGNEYDQTVEKYEKEILRNMIDEALLVQKANELSLTADSTVIKTLDDIRRDNNLSDLEALDKLMIQQGVDPAEFKENLKKNNLRDQVMGREVYSRLSVTGEEISKYYDEHKQEFDRPEQVAISEILILTEGKDRALVPSLEAKAQEALKKARSGEKFDELAKKYSDGPTAKDGGDLGFFTRGKMVKELEDSAFKLRRGQVSDIIRTKYGFVIIRVDEKYAAGIQKLETVSEEIHRILAQQKAQPAIQEYMKKLRSQAFIEVKPGYVDTGAVAKEEAAKPADEAKLSDNAKTKDKAKPAKDKKEQKKKKWIILRLLEKSASRDPRSAWICS